MGGGGERGLLDSNCAVRHHFQESFSVIYCFNLHLSSYNFFGSKLKYSGLVQIDDRIEIPVHSL